MTEPPLGKVTPNLAKTMNSFKKFYIIDIFFAGIGSIKAFMLHQTPLKPWEKKKSVSK